MTTLLLRADAGPGIGVGHLSRCVAFAEAAVARGWRVLLSGEVAAGRWFAELDLLDLPVLPPAGDADALAVQAQDVGAELVLVDHYGLGGDLWAAVRNTGARLVSMEDGEYGRRRADVVVDCGLATSARPEDGSPVVLTGPRFAPLRAAARRAREHRRRLPNRRPAGPSRVVVVLGGGDTRSAMAAVLETLRDTRLPMDVLAISATPLAPPEPADGQRFAVDGPRADLLTLFAEADLVVSAAGVTLLELCCVGVPTVLVRLVDNQTAGYRVMLDQAVAVGLDEAGTLLSDPARRAGLAGRMARLVDGLGAGRVLDRA